MKIGILNPFDFHWKGEDIQTKVIATRIENERLRQVHPFVTVEITIKDYFGKVIKELKVNAFGYSIEKELGKI